MDHRPRVGDVVLYYDSGCKQHNALVTSVNGDGNTPHISLTFVGDDERKTNSFGRLTLSAAHIPHRSMTLSSIAMGMYWKWPEEITP